MIRNNFVVANSQFIVRQVGNPDLYYKGEMLPLKEISQNVKLTERDTVPKITKIIKKKKNI
ncbi:MAG: hypothetical protein ACE5JB_16035 [bacterium]